MTFTSPDRPTSPMSVVTFVVPASIATRTASRSKLPPASAAPQRAGGCRSSLQEVTPDEGHVLEDAQAEGEECDQVQVDAQPIAHEGERDRHQGIRDEPGEKDAIVVVGIELGADR